LINRIAIDEALAAFYSAENARNTEKRSRLSCEELQGARVRLCKAAKGAGQEAALLIPWEHVAWNGEKWRGNGGSCVENIIEEFVLLAGVLGKTLSFEFNGIPLSVTPDSFPSRIEAAYWEKRGGP